MAAYYLGWSLQGQGRFEDALALHQEHASHSVDGLHHGYALWGLGSAEAGLGMQDEAESAYREALRILEDRLGPRHDKTLRVKLALGMLLLAEGRADEAEPLIQAALKGAESLYDENRRELADFRIAAGWLQLAGGHPESAEPLLRSGVKIWESALTARDGRIAMGRVLLGSCLGDLGRRAEGEPLVAANLSAVGPPAHPVLASASLEQASRFFEQGGDVVGAARARASVVRFAAPHRKEPQAPSGAAPARVSGAARP